MQRAQPKAPSNKPRTIRGISARKVETGEGPFGEVREKLARSRDRAEADDYGFRPYFLNSRAVRENLATLRALAISRSRRRPRRMGAKRIWARQCLRWQRRPGSARSEA